MWRGQHFLARIVCWLLLVRTPFAQVKRSEANGGDKVYTSLTDLEEDYKSGALHPGAQSTGALRFDLQPTDGYLSAQPPVCSIRGLISGLSALALQAI
jgi:hypothetical protein